MIDTITIRLAAPQFRITDHYKFSPDTHNFFYPPYAKMGGRAYLDSYQNPTRSELKEGEYKPQLTVRKRWQDSEPLIFLYVQFSAPKILFGNNFDELKDTDLDEVINVLNSRPSDMGVITSKTELLKAKVVKIHYSKNIVLPDYIIPSMLIGEVRKVDFNLHRELTERDYRNSGQSLRFHVKDFELILYDKKKDMQKSIDKDNTLQLELFEKIQRKRPFEVLRIEIRLNSTNRIKDEVGIPKKDHTLERLFDTQISIKVLQRYWTQLNKGYKSLNYDIQDKEKFLASFLVNNPEARISNAFTTYAMLEFLQDIGTSKLRNLIDTKFSKRTWFNLKANLNKYKLNGELPDYFNAISDSLKKYTPLNLKDHLI